MNIHQVFKALLVVAASASVKAETINIDFGPIGSPTYTGMGPLATPANPVWNNVQPAAQGTNISNTFSVENLQATDGTATEVGVQLASGFFRAFADDPADFLTSDRVFSRNGNTATLKIEGLDASRNYDLYMIGGAWPVSYTINGSRRVISGNDTDESTWQAGADHTVFSEIQPDALGTISVRIRDGSSPFTSFGIIAGMQITESATRPATSLATSASFVQKPETVELSWTVPLDATSVSISPGIGDVLPQTVDGAGSISVAPFGNVDYQLIVDGNVVQTTSVVGLPEKNKVHLYLMIGQSNMEGFGRNLDPVLDAPTDRIVQFGSRDGRESEWVLAQHPLTELGASGIRIGMGLEFSKAMLAAETDPDVVIGIINHALGTTAIQFWEPGGATTRQSNLLFETSYMLYDEAVQRTLAAKDFGTLKAVLWHQGEYNSNNNANPSPDPDGYAARLSNLVNNLRTDLGDQELPFICGKFVPASWVDANGVNQVFTGLPFRATVEAALDDLPNQESNTSCVSNAGLRGHNDERIHFDAFSQRLLGQRYATELMAINADPFVKYLGGFYSPAQLDDPLIAALDADPDGDNINNLAEFAFGSAPDLNDNSVLPSVSTLGNDAVFTYRRRRNGSGSTGIDYVADGVAYTVQVSETLRPDDWQSGSDYVEEMGTPIDNGDGTETVNLRIVVPGVASPSELFVRLLVEY